MPQPKMQKQDDDGQSDAERLAEKREELIAKEEKEQADNQPGAEFVDVQENGVGDVTKAQEQALADQLNPERDEETGIAKVSSPATAALNAEQSKRAVGAGEGGGRFPADILRARYMDPTPVYRSVVDAYTSHETQD